MLGLTSSITEERCATLAQTLARISCASVVKNALKLQGIVHNGGRRCQLRSEETHKKFSEKERTLSRTGATKRCCLNTNMCGVTLGVSTTVKKNNIAHRFRPSSCLRGKGKFYTEVSSLEGTLPLDKIRDSHFV